MGVDTTIIFAPVDKSWVGTPDFIRAVAAMFRINTFKNFRIHCEVAASPGVELAWHERSKTLLDAHDIPLETAILRQRTDPGHSTYMSLEGSPFDDELLAEMSNHYDDLWFDGLGIYHGFNFTNGAWEAYENDDEDGQPGGSGMCKLDLWVDGSPAGGAEEFLEGFLALKTVARLRDELERLSARPWLVLVHVW